MFLRLPPTISTYDFERPPPARSQWGPFVVLGHTLVILLAGSRSRPRLGLGDQSNPWHGTRSRLTHGQIDMQHEAVRGGHVGSYELHVGLHQCRDEGHVAGQSIQLGDDEGGFLPLGHGKGSLQLWPLLQGQLRRRPPRLNVRVLPDQLPSTTVEVVENSLLLRLEAQA